jgi:hypothetical protein
MTTAGGQSAATIPRWGSESTAPSRPDRDDLACVLALLRIELPCFVVSQDEIVCVGSRSEELEGNLPGSSSAVGCGGR